MDNPWKIVSIVFIILFALSVMLGFAGAYGQVSGSALFSSSKSPDATAQKAVSFIHDNLIGAGQDVSLRGIYEESGVLRISTELSSPDGNQTIDVFLSRDGKYLFPASYRMDNVSENRRATGSVTAKTVPQAASCADIKKQDEPVMEAFVVSSCPYGSQMQRVMADIVSSLPSLSPYLRVRYIGWIAEGSVQSMHGPAEAQENLRQICIREEQPEAYWKYVSCFINGTPSDTCLMNTGIDRTKLSGCMSDPARGLRYAGIDFNRSAGYGITASPTLVLNGVPVSEMGFGGRNPEAIKNLVCCGFSTQPGSCATTLPGSTTAIASQGTC